MSIKIAKYHPFEIDCIVGHDGYLGKGSCGVVRLGYHKSLGSVAIKCYTPQSINTTTKHFMNRPENEASVMQMFNLSKQFPENIVRFYGCVQWDYGTALVMEYLPNRDLASLLLNTDVNLGMFLRLRMCNDIANGLAVIHNLSKHLPSKKVMVHGDMKAENVLLTAHLRCKIADFGSSKLLSSTGLSTTFTQSALRNEFTSTYAAPELLKDPSLKPLTPSIDTYSYGMIVYLVLRREYPFSTTTKDLYLNNVKNGQMPEPSCDETMEAECKDYLSIAQEPVDVLKTIMVQCQSYMPSERPAMGDVAHLLKDKLAKHLGAVSIQRDVALKNIQIEQPQRQTCTYKSINKFKPPFFQNQVIGLDETNVAFDHTLAETGLTRPWTANQSKCAQSTFSRTVLAATEKSSEGFRFNKHQVHSSMNPRPELLASPTAKLQASTNPASDRRAKTVLNSTKNSSEASILQPCLRSNDSSTHQSIFVFPILNRNPPGFKTKKPLGLAFRQLCEAIRNFFSRLCTILFSSRSVPEQQEFELQERCPVGLDPEKDLGDGPGLVRSQKVYNEWGVTGDPQSPYS